ncbi:hypothetical protein A3759_01330 [Thalassolituus sp. HI0120]|nr:hypothetical protein A3759_01330 [Thalassolituus sp. HI0120]
MNAYSKTALAAAITTALTACSSGSTSNDDSQPSNNGSDDNQQTEAVTVERVSLTGLAVKGNVLNAQVEMFKILNGTVDTTAFATGTTDSNGRYSLLAVSETPYNGPALVKISHRTGAKMVCDSPAGCVGTQQADDQQAPDGIQFNELFDLPTDFEMTAILPRVNTSKETEQVFSANVTSLTHASAQFVSSQSTIDETLIRQLNNRIRTMFGLSGNVDLLLTEPTDVTNSDVTADQAALYGSLTAALADIAKQKDITVGEVLNQFSNSLSAEGQLLWNNKTDTSKISIEEILAAAQRVITELKRNSSSDFTLIDQVVVGGITNANGRPGDGPGSISDFNPPTAIPPANQQIIVGNQAILSGSSDQSDVSYSWSKISGPVIPDVSFPVTAQNLDITPNIAGDYEFDLTVSKAGQTGSARVRVTVESLPGAASLVAGKYSLLAGTADFAVNDPGTSNRSLALELGTERTTGFELEAGSGSNLTLNFDGTIENDWDLTQSFTTNAVFSGTDAPKSTISGNLSNADIDTGAGSEPGEVDSEGNISIDAGADLNIESDRINYYFARRVDLVEVAPGSYVSTQLARESEVGKTADNQPDFSDRKRESTIVDTLIFNKDDGSFTGTNIQPEYGVISVELGSDESNGQAIASELQTWETVATDSGFNLKRKTDSSLNKVGRIISRFSAGLTFDGNTYTQITDPTLRDSVTSNKDTSGEANDSDALPAFFLSDGSSLFNIPSSLLDEVLDGYSNASAIFEGLFSPQGEVINVNLMVKGSLGQFNGTNIVTQVLNRNIGVAIDNADPGTISGEYRIQGIEYGIRKGSPGVQVAALNGTLSFNGSAAEFDVQSDDVSLVTENNFFGVNVTGERNSGTVTVTTAANGRITLSDIDTTLEGFVSTDKKRMVLRLISKEAVDSANTPASQADEARHGYVIATLIEDQTAQ